LREAGGVSEGERRLRAELAVERLRRSLGRIADEETDWGGDICSAPSDNLNLCVDGMMAEARDALATPDFATLRNYVLSVESLLGENAGFDPEADQRALTAVDAAHEELLREYPFLNPEEG
jgi:hypothetical protein